VNAIRPAVHDDIPACLVLRGRTRENAISAERLAAMGITAQSWADDVRSGALTGFVCTAGGAIVGYCFGDNRSGEVVVLALLPAHEGLGIGQRLLDRVVRHLASGGHRRLFLGCSADSATRSFGFYRHMGWVSTGSFDPAGDEILERFTAGAECPTHSDEPRAMHPYVSLLNSYMTALGESDYATVKSLFAPGGKVLSPFLGEMLAGPFFDRLAGASTKNVITPIDVFLSATDKNLATAYFQYDWTVRDGTLISFKVMDLFTFDPTSGLVTYLDLIYDTHPIRASAGNKYEL
jgi:ribosomal protein S18 acetylase RimI-like enzyme